MSCWEICDREENSHEEQVEEEQADRKHWDDLLGAVAEEIPPGTRIWRVN
jgi:hypothetical protein